MRSPARPTRHAKRPATCLLLIYAALALSCAVDQKSSGLPAQAQAAIDSIGEDIGQGRYEKIYNEAAAEWQSANTPEQSEAAFQTLKEKLGAVRTRAYQTAREEQSSSGPLPGHTLVVTYYTTFERGEGMETFTLVERKGQWQLARYFVNSNTLK